MGLSKYVEGDEFRTAFKELKTLKACFPSVPFVALSGTLTSEQKKNLPKQLCLSNYTVIESSPDKPNLFLEKFDKGSSCDVEGEYEAVTHGICDRLFQEREKFPVTMLFLQVYYMSQVLMYLNSIFQPTSIDTALNSAICSGQNEYVIDRTVNAMNRSVRECSKPLNL
ncbi:uncharacterized protein LOC127832477 [Dreissena polymorpha]|uniref:uncharacterized protein LOC127832477 n=1 Tax=Dreissena polymorpha TaxID=45954 RepID=UPI002263E6A5|nr:uncharacterized protein LOC127832477 [Dreissena polymorpha]